MKGIKIGGAVICLIGAAIYASCTWGGEEAIPESTEYNTTWRCAACEHQFDLTGREFHDALQRTNDSEPLYCVACTEKKAYRVAQCLACEAWYFGIDVPGATGRCPVCEPDFEPPVHLEEEPLIGEEGNDVFDQPKRRRRTAPNS